MDRLTDHHQSRVERVPGHAILGHSATREREQYQRGLSHVIQIVGANERFDREEDDQIGSPAKKTVEPGWAWDGELQFQLGNRWELHHVPSPRPLPSALTRADSTLPAK
jgi:hypothetical protein